jgi:hypothetical protein
MYLSRLSIKKNYYHNLAFLMDAMKVYAIYQQIFLLYN